MTTARVVPLTAPLLVALLSGTVHGADEKPTVTLALIGATAKPGENGQVNFECQLRVENNTGVELKVSSTFYSAFDGLELVVEDNKGKVLKRQAYIQHQSPRREAKDYTIATGKTIGTVVFPVTDLPSGTTDFKLRVCGTLPGSTYKLPLATEVLAVELKGK